jgi:DNA-binding PadR family transcriptional regulator
MTGADWFGDFFNSGFGIGVGGQPWCRGGPWSARGHRHGGHRRRRQQIFESGEVKYVILRLLKDKPRHGYEVMKALEEKLGGWYTPSAGTIYPTLQLLEDQGYVRVVESDGKRVYHITPEGEAFLEEHRDVTDDIFDRLRDAVRSFDGGAMADVNRAFARLAREVYGRAWRYGPEDPFVKRMAEILKQAADEVEAAGKKD